MPTAAQKRRKVKQAKKSTGGGRREAQAHAHPDDSGDPADDVDDGGHSDVSEGMAGYDASADEPVSVPVSLASLWLGVNNCGDALYRFV